MTVTLHKNDIPAGLSLGPSIAVDTEAMGLNNKRDRLCLVQLSAGDGNAHLVQFAKDQYDAPNLRKLLSDPDIVKIFQFARFDIAIMKEYLGIVCAPLYCTKIASKIARTYSDRHGLRELCRELLGVELNKQQQATDWGADTLTDEQMAYAASDVLHLHALRERLDIMLKREGRFEIARATMDFLPTRATLDLSGWAEVDIFAH